MEKEFPFQPIKGRLLSLFKVAEDGKYMLATFWNHTKQIFFLDFGRKSLTKGSFEYAYENKSGFEVLNVVALIPVKDFEAAQNKQTLLLSTSV